MRVSEAVRTRRSVRGFLETPVDPAVIRAVIERAARAPSGGNLQPWHIDVVMGAPLAELKAIMARRVPEMPRGETPEYPVYPAVLDDPYRSHRHQVGEDMYGHIGIARDDREGRMRWFARNYQFFGAPVALFCTVARTMGSPQWSDLGMYLQTVMLLLREEGLDSCAQECWSIYPDTVKAFLGTPDTRMLFCGMAIGFADPDEPANRLVSRRAAVEDFATFRGC